jgi:4-amino-4-deoxy-L-arabinose transferase-like glycosyltransferase
LDREPEPHKPKASRAERLIWTAVAILALVVFGLYLRTLDKQSLWFDEGLSVAFAGRSLPQLMRTLIYEDLHPPLYYLLLHFWMLLAGNSAWAVRLPSAVAAALLVPLAFAVVREVWADEPGTLQPRFLAGLSAAVLVGSSPFIAYYAQETRMYSLAAVLALAATWAYLRALRSVPPQAGLHSTGQRWWVAFSGFLAASLYTQYLSVFVVPAFVCYALLVDRKALARTARYILLAALLYLPWVVPTGLQLGRLIRTPDYWVATRISPMWFVRAMWSTFLPSARLLWGAAAGAAILLLLGVLAIRRRFTLSERARRAVLVFLACLIPLALTYVTVSLAPKFAARYAIVMAAPLYICIALALYAILGSRPLGRILMALLVLGAVVVTSRSALAVLDGHENPRDDARGLAAYLTQNAQANDTLFLTEDAPYALTYYYRGAAPWQGLHVGQDFSQAAARLNALLRGHPRRVWLVLWHYEFADPTDMLVTELLRVGQEVDVPQQFLGYRLRAFDIRDYKQTIAAYPQPAQAMQAEFASGLRLLGFDRLPDARGQLHYVMYWQAQQHLQRNYSLTLSFQDADGHEYLRQDEALCTDYFLPPAWPVQTPIRGRVDVVLPSDLPPLTYRVYLQVLDPVAQRNLDVVDAHGSAQGQVLALEELALSKASLGQTPAPIRNPVQADMGDGLQLLGFDLPAAEYRQGEGAQLTLWWQSASKPHTDHQVRVRLLDHKRAVAWEHQQPLLPGHPTTSWQPGEINRAIYTFVIPADLPAGEYSLQAGSENRVISMAQVRITSREHHYDVPAMQHALGTRFGRGITLLGYDLQPAALRPGQALTVTLYWQPEQAISDSFKVSVQLLADDLHVVAQEDSVPVGWTYPTTAWLPGEVIADQHVVALKPELVTGEYRLIVALYEEQGKTRLLAEQAGTSSDHVLLAPLRVAP